MGPDNAISRKSKRKRMPGVEQMQSQFALALDAGEESTSAPSRDVPIPTHVGSRDRQEVRSFPPPETTTSAASELTARFEPLLVHQQYPVGSTRGRLVAALNECFQNGRVPRGKPKTQINRVHFASLIGVTKGMISYFKDIFVAYDECLEAIEPFDSLPYTEFDAAVPVDGEQPSGEQARQVTGTYPALYKHQFYPKSGSASRIVSLLNEQLVEHGCIKRSRGGKVDRTSIANQLGFSPSNMYHFADIVSDYEKAVGGVESVHEAKIPAMRQWLEQSMADRTLKIRDRKIERKELFAKFELGDSRVALTRYPRIAQLIDEFDERIKITSYWPLRTDMILESMQTILANDPPLDKDGVTISRLALEAHFALLPGQASRPPFGEMIRIAEEKLRVELANDRLIAMLFGRIFRFEKLVAQGWSVSYATRVRDSFLRAYRSSRDKDAAKRYFYAIEQLMTFVSHSDARACELVKKGLESRQPMDSLERGWTIVTQLYRDSLIARYPHTSSANKVVSDTNSVIRTLANDGVLPKLDLPLIQCKRDFLHTLTQSSPVYRG